MGIFAGTRLGIEVEEPTGTLWLFHTYPRHDPWDCHRTADQARGGTRGVNGAAYMAVPWSVWALFLTKGCMFHAHHITTVNTGSGGATG